jgi:hypothetical protein
MRRCSGKREAMSRSCQQEAVSYQLSAISQPPSLSHAATAFAEAALFSRSQADG